MLYSDEKYRQFVEHIGLNLCLYRKHRGMHRRNMAILCGISEPTLIAYEQGTCEPPFKDLLKMACLLTVEPHEFLSNTYTQDDDHNIIIMSCFDITDVPATKKKRVKLDDHDTLYIADTSIVDLTGNIS